MPTFYMIFWSIMMILALGIWRLRQWGHVLVVAAVTALVLILSQSFFIQLALSAGLDPNTVLVSPMDFLLSGPLGWLALLVMPCGWLGPFIGFSLVRRWSHFEEVV
ncbi:MAG: hypothetical protein H6667_16070 [Ardenticatenaceae bacterium]|nr:hypothetical protein [Ardenticatenaceae bacterium]MCB9443650.1 hypothetical protein [Ardenticatenaceae bacterium]